MWSSVKEKFYCSAAFCIWKRKRNKIVKTKKNTPLNALLDSHTFCGKLHKQISHRLLRWHWLAWKRCYINDDIFKIASWCAPVVLYHFTCFIYDCRSIQHREPWEKFRFFFFCVFVFIFSAKFMLQPNKWQFFNLTFVHRSAIKCIMHSNEEMLWNLLRAALRRRLPLEIM